MSVAVEEQIRRIPMLLDEFLAHQWEEGERAEWLNGVAIVSPAPRKAHQIVAKRLVRLIDDALAGAEAFWDMGLELERSRRIPDISVEPDRTVGDEEAYWSRTMPLMVVEVISPSSRTEDRVRKVNEYLAAGIAYYLLVDRHEGTLIALHNEGDSWEPVLELDERAPAGELTVGEYGTVAFDLTTLFAF